MATTTETAGYSETAWSYGPRTATLFVAFVAVALVGWLVSVFLSGIHFWAIPQIPAGAELSGSLQVITSEWAYVGPVPLATLGAGYYLTTIVLAAWWFETRHPFVVKVLTPVTATGVVASAYFVYLQLGVIGAICPFCMASAAASTVLFGLEVAILRQSDLPPTRQLGSGVRELVAQTSLGRLLFVAALGGLTLAAVYGVTLAPVPGS